MSDTKIDLSAFDEPTQELDLSAFDDGHTRNKEATPAEKLRQQNYKNSMDRINADLKLSGESLPDDIRTSTLESAKRGALEGASLNFGDELAGGVEAAGHLFGVAGAGNSPIDKIRKESPDEATRSFMEAYRQGRDENRVKNEIARKSHPIAYSASGMAASIPAAFSIPGGPLGALMGVGASEAELTKPEDIISNLGKTAAHGVVGSALGEGLPSAINTAGLGAAKGTAHVLGKGKYADEYLNNPAKFKDPSLTSDEVFGEVDNAVRNIENRRLDARDQLSAAEKTAQRARDQYERSLRDTDVPDEAVEATRAALKQQAENVNKKYEAQTKVLEDSDTKIPISDAREKLTQALKQLEVKGRTSDIDPEVAELKRLIRLVDDYSGSNEESVLLDAFGNKLKRDADEVFSASDVQNLRKSVGRVNSSAYDQNVGAHVGRSAAAGRRFSGELNSIVDSRLPAHSPLRKETAEATDLRNKASDIFGDTSPDALRNLLSRIPGDTSKEKLALLQKLDQSTGGQIMPKLQKYFDARRVLKSPDELSAKQAALPESVAEQKAQAAYEAATDAHKQIGNLTDRTSQGAVRKAMFSSDLKPEFRTKEALEALSKESGIDHLDRIHSFKVKHDFDSGTPNGSRLVNLGKATLGAIPLVGKPLGAALGAIADYSTGPMARNVLDLYTKLSPSVSASLGGALTEFSTSLGGRTDAKAQRAKKLISDATAKGPDALMTTLTLLKNDPDFKDMYRSGEE